MFRLFRRRPSPRRWRFVGLALGVFTTGIAVLPGCVSFSMSPREVTEFFAERKQGEPRLVTFTTAAGRTVRYAEVPRPGAPVVVFIHGAPGSWDAFAGYLADGDLRQRAWLVSVDRLGYGGSEPGRPESSLAAQAEVVATVIERVGGGPAVVVGHSLGGPVAARVAMDHPASVRGLVLLAPSIDPDLEPDHWYQYVAAWPGVRRLLPRDLRVCNEEILPLRGELAAMLPGWAALRGPVIVLQGGRDTLVPPGNADFAARVLPAGVADIRRDPEANHFLPWNRPAWVEQAISELLAGAGTSGAVVQPDGR